MLVHAKLFGPLTGSRIIIRAMVILQKHELKQIYKNISLLVLSKHYSKENSIHPQRVEVFPNRISIFVAKIYWRKASDSKHDLN